MRKEYIHLRVCSGVLEFFASSGLWSCHKHLEEATNQEIGIAQLKKIICRLQYEQASGVRRHSQSWKNNMW